ncbi:hypothetical protein GCM10007385_40380 [Tateyamaria omphalii]|uniref:hypothetical protein n=1 Tax=Tateyamaria omphalii TaxID=299262 RepID=UPI001676ACEF|nr:hypothetical protein [Tateyamaria omphalii]GGX67218.1 hypothetical protein GCM10007385_40380 [Tateyamaria omphalii]
MKRCICTLLAVSFLTVPAHAFDRKTTEALRLCHDYLWEVPEYADLPNAAISVFPGVFDDQSITVFWNIYWDAPTTRSAGNCTIINGTLEGFEDYLAQD